MPDVRSPRRTSRRRSAAVLALLLAVAVSVGCTPDASDADPSTSSSPDPSASASGPAPTADLEPAVVPFGGDCARVLDADAVERFVGEDAVAYDGGTLADGPDVDASFALAGGLVCSWSEPDSGRYAGVSVYPADVLDPARSDLRDGSSAQTCDASTATCLLSVVTDGTVFEVVANADDATDPTNSIVANDVMAVLLGRAQGQPAPRAHERGANWWGDVDCRVTDIADAVFGVQGARPTLPGSPVDPDAQTTWQRAMVLRDCYASGWDTELPFTVGATVQQGLGEPTAAQLDAAEAVPVEVPGTDSAYRAGSWMIAVVGPNRLTVFAERRDGDVWEISEAELVGITELLVGRIGD